MLPIDDIEVVDKVLSGDTEAFSLIVERYRNMTFRYVYSRFNNYDEAMDITQDIFIMSLEALKSFRRESKFSTWFYSIMVNYCKNYRKKSKRYNVVPISGGKDDDEYELQIPDDRAGPEENVITNDSLRIVKDEIYRLPDDYKEVLVLRDIEGLSYNDISEMVGINLSNVKVRIHRGRELLKNRLSERGLI
ncbi:MAG: RNA polymerase sigma factor [Spirochaetia bacterium]|jgi:RNA polymerase sigma-70 factor (ECF subfamily)|nr:RNA polymerase sigma factor [Spirochaetia bacterium]